MSKATESNTAPAPAAHPTTCALRADRGLLQLIGDWRIHRAQQLLNWAQFDLRESLDDQDNKADTDPLEMMKTLEDVLSRGRPKSMRGAIKILEVAHTILSYEHPEDYMADGPVVEILRNVIRALEYCDAGEPIGKLRMELRKPHGDDGNGDVEELASASKLARLIEADKAAMAAFRVACTEAEASRDKPNTAWSTKLSAENASLMAVCRYDCHSLDEVRTRAEYLLSVRDWELRLQPEHIEALLRSSSAAAAQ